VAEKGLMKIKFLIFTVMANSQRERKNLNSFSIDPSAEGCLDVFVKLAELFPKGTNIFLCAGQKTVLGPGNTATLRKKSGWLRKK
jgi:hypothetical protein